MPRAVSLHALLLCIIAPVCAFAGPAQTVWLEAESFAPLKGGNFSYQKSDATTKGSWSVSGPGVAAEWTQGGESEWMSIAARADEPGEVVAGRDAIIAVAGRYTLWVRYADYREKKETFGVRIRQGEKTFSHVFGNEPVVDELDPMKLLWDWSFGWDRAEVDLEKGPARVEVYTTGPTEARRQVDCLCLTTDSAYHPVGREKPDHPTWAALRRIRDAKAASPASPAGQPSAQMPQAWNIADGPPTFLWNVAVPWLDELKKPDEAKDRMDTLFCVDPPLVKDYLATMRGKDKIPVFGSALSSPAWHIPQYPALFATATPFDRWLDRHPGQKFAVLLNYGEPNWPAKADAPADRAAAREAVKKRGGRFVGYVAGENLSYAEPDKNALEARIRAATSRGEVLAALRDLNTAATARKLTGYYGADVPAEQAWKDMIPCLSANDEAYAHALAAWGCARIGHEGTGNSPTLARRLAFLRGAARQFGCKIADYQSCNLGDASTIFDREAFFYPASSRYIVDNQYDAWAGSGVNWVLKDYLLFHLAGADLFYHEEGQDIFWKPGGGSAGDDAPVQLSPRGKVTQAIVRLAESHPRGAQFTPVAFLLDEAHGWSQERYVPGSFGLDPQLNPPVLTPGRHEASIRGWFDVAYFPAPETQNEPASAIRQTYVNGIFGDIFDVIVTAPKHAAITRAYPVLIAAGEAPLTEEWGRALDEYVKSGGTLVCCDGSFTGPGSASLGLPQALPENVSATPPDEADSFVWKPTGENVSSNVFRFRPLPAAAANSDQQVLATIRGNVPVAISTRRGRGVIITIGIPLGLGLDDRPVPLLAYLMRRLTRDVVPIDVAGDVEWTLNRLADASPAPGIPAGPVSPGGWLVGLLNNRGINKPQHGINPTDAREAQTVTLTVPFVVRGTQEWVAGQKVTWQADAKGHSSATLTIPAGAVRLVAIEPAPF